MHIIIANDFAALRGGADQIAFLGARGLAERGHRVTFFAPVGPVEGSLLNHNNITVQCLGEIDILNDSRRFRAFWRGLWNTHVADALSELLSKNNPRETVVHVHGWTKALTTAVFPRLNKRGYTPIVSLHDYFCACPNGIFFDYPTRQICHRKPLGFSCTVRQCDRRNYGHKLWRLLRQHVQKRWGQFPKSVRHAIASSDLNGRVLTPFFSKTTKVYHVNNPVDFTQQPPAPVAVNRHFTFVGRLTNEKAPDHFAYAATALGVAARFVGEGEMRKEIQRICPQAEITGWQSRDQILGHLCKARALVFPSIWYEGQPLVPKEALALGVPLVVSDKSAAVESVVDGKNGLIYKGGDINDLKEKLQRLDDDLLIARMGQYAYEHYWANPPTPANYAIELEAIFTRVLATQSGSGD